MDSAGDADTGPVYSTAEVLLLFGDREDGLAQARAAALRVGCRIAAEATVVGGADRLEAQLGCDAALIEAVGPSIDFDALLTSLAGAARAGRMNGVVVAPPAMIDAIAAADLPREIAHLCEPSDAQLDEALAEATARTPARLHDRSGGSLLQQLSEDAARIAAMLASLSQEEAGGAEPEGEEPDEVDAGFVRGIIRARRLRDQYFPSALFADPGFDMLLDLYASRLEGVPVAVSSLCIAASVPPTTALRWIRALTDKGLFLRTADPEDGRRIYISLADDTARAMGRYLAAVQKAGLPTV